MVIALQIMHLSPAAGNQELVLLMHSYDNTLVFYKLQEEFYLPPGTC